MRNTENIEIKIYPLILESALTASHLWHLIRALDISGSGKVSFTKEELISILGVSKSTVYTYLKSPLFTRIVKHKNREGVLVYTFYYKSFKQVAKMLKIENVISSSFCFWNDIKHFMDKRRTATEVIAESLQARSFYCARNKKDNKQHLINTDNIFSDNQLSVSDNTPGIKRTDYGIFFNVEYYAPYGGSQNTISKVLNRCRQTINKRLKNKIKVQQFVKRDLTALQFAQQQFVDSEDFTNVCSSKYICKFGEVYEKYTNLYKPLYVLKLKHINQPSL